jgi:SAM-dependent methyltransferase
MQTRNERAINVPKNDVSVGLREFTGQLMRNLARCVVPQQFRPWLRNPGSLRLHALRAPVLRQLTALRFRRLHPMFHGRPVGTAIVRCYWNDFLERHRDDVHGDALEVGTTSTICAYGGARLRSAHAIDLTAHTPDVKLVADLSRADELPGERYDCFVLQFTMHVIGDVEAALYHAVRLLKPGGVLLVNFSCVDAQFPRGLDMGTGAPMWVHWCFTPLQVHNLIRGIGLVPHDYTLETHGNLFARIAYQLNMPSESLTHEELTQHDPAWPVLICARIVRPAGWKPTPPAYRQRWVPPDAAPEQHPDVAGNGLP